MRLIATLGSRCAAVLGLAAILALSATPAAHAAPVTYVVTLNGPNEFPANASPGTGTATADLDVTAHTLHLHVDFSGLIGTTTASHIHAPTAVALTGTAGVATTTPYFAGFPIGVTAGTYDNTLDLTQASSYNPSFVTAQGGLANAEAALEAAIAAGKAYLNIHTQAFPGGEIRGFLVPQATPAEAASWGRIKSFYR